MESLFPNTTSNSDSSRDSLDSGRSILDTKYSKFERYFKRLIKLGREVLTKDHTFERPGKRFLYANEYLHLRDRVYGWIARSENSSLFTDCDSYFLLAQMATMMSTVEQALVIPHVPFTWPGAASGLRPHWPDVQMRDVYRQVDELVHHGGGLDIEGMSRNGEEVIGVNG
ncbi:hypothetical protein EKO04_001289 [Ascochyta lentis]|uniref:Uncharacterized protein n=1 Tax=Ascochyta lentis TaxID=205686 RepID=A0A8H7MMT8_9PLEO|nr:hypothetical protein EKO04_001289 [Ascochyta lentis]